MSSILRNLSFKTINISTIAFIIPIILIYFMPMKIIGMNLKNELVLPLSLLFFLFCFVFLKFSFKTYSVKYIIYGLFFSSVFLFILLLNQETIIIKDIVECFKPLYFCLFFVIGRKAAETYSLESVARFIVILLLLGVLFSSLVYFQLSYPILDLYKGRTSDESNLYHFLRFSGFFGYPSMFGIYLILGMILTISVNFTKYKKLTLFLLFVGFVLTMSKTGFILFGLLVGYYLVMKGTIKDIILSASISFIIFLLISIYFFDEFLVVFNAFSSIDGLLSSTFSHRFREIILSINILISENFDGFGPSNIYLKKNHGPVENVLFFYVFKFGYFGLIYYINLILFTAYKFFSEKETPIKLLLLWCLLSLLIGSLAESITEEYKTLYFFPLLLGFFSNKRCKQKYQLVILDEKGMKSFG